MNSISGLYSWVSSFFIKPEEALEETPSPIPETPDLKCPKCKLVFNNPQNTRQHFFCMTPAQKVTLKNLSNEMQAKRKSGTVKMVRDLKNAGHYDDQPIDSNL